MANLKPKTQEFMNLYKKIEKTKNILNNQIGDFLKSTVFRLSTSILSFVSKEKQQNPDLWQFPAKRLEKTKQMLGEKCFVDFKILS